MSRTRKTCVATFLVALAAGMAPGAASAATRWAEPGGDGPAASCPKANPCGIADAITDASLGTGDVINLTPGTYPVTIEMQPPAKVTIRGVPGRPRPTIAADFTGSAGERSVIALVHSGSVVRDLNIRVNEDSDFLSLGIESVSSNVLVERVDAAATGATGSAILMDSANGGTTLVRDSLLRSAGAQPAIRIAGLVHPAQAHVKLLNITARATGTSVAHALIIPDNYGHSRVTARNSIFEAVNESVIRLDTSAGDAQVELLIDHSNYAAPPVVTGGPPSDASVTTGAGNQTTPAGLVNRDAGNFNQLRASVTVDAGILDPDRGPTDLYGEPRVTGPRTDIGADEFDYVRPRTRITKGPPRRLHRRSAVIRFRSSEPGSFQCRLDRGRWRKCRSPKRLRRLKPGRHVFRVRAIDRAGNRDKTPAVRRFRVV